MRFRKPFLSVICDQMIWTDFRKSIFTYLLSGILDILQITDFTYMRSADLDKNRKILFHVCTFLNVPFHLYSFCKLLWAIWHRQAGRQTGRQITFPIRTKSKVIFLMSLCFFFIMLSRWRLSSAVALYVEGLQERKTDDFVSNLCWQALQVRVMTFAKHWHTYKTRYSWSF